MPGDNISPGIFSVYKKSILTFLFTLQNRRKVLFYRLFCDIIFYSRRALPPRAPLLLCFRTRIHSFLTVSKCPEIIFLRAFLGLHNISFKEGPWPLGRRRMKETDSLLCPRVHKAQTFRPKGNITAIFKKAVLPVPHQGQTVM